MPVFEPRKTKYRKQFKGRLKTTVSKRTTELAFGQYGLKSMEAARISSKQLEACRKAISSKTERKGEVFFRTYPSIPVTAKPTDSRMGSGKGALSHYISRVSPGTILIELNGVEASKAIAALEVAGSKLPCKTKIVFKEIYI